MKWHRSEADEQRQVIQWARIARNQMDELRYLVHIPNQGKRSPRTGRQFKNMGLSPGFPDLFLFVPVPPFSGLAIEMKTSTGKVSDSQEWWIEKLQEQGYDARVCRGAEQAIDVILRYLRGNHDAGRVRKPDEAIRS